MGKIEKEKIILSTRQILLYLVDAFVATHDLFDSYKYYYKTTRDYFRWRDFDKMRFQQDLYRLKKRKFIDSYYKGKERYIRLTKKGREKVKKLLLDNIGINIPKDWDYKWRMVIFDVPEKKKKARDILAKKLKQLGFLPLQKSVFVFPFECREIITRIKNWYEISQYVQYVVAEEIETEVNLIGYFFDDNKFKEVKLKKINDKDM